MLFLRAFGCDEGQIVSPSTRQRIRRAATRGGLGRPPVDATHRKPLAMDGLDQDSRDFLREGAVLQRRSATERFLQLVRHIRTYENALSVGHGSDSS